MYRSFHSHMTIIRSGTHTHTQKQCQAVCSYPKTTYPNTVVATFLKFEACVTTTAALPSLPADDSLHIRRQFLPRGLTTDPLFISSTRRYGICTCALLISVDKRLNSIRRIGGIIHIQKLTTPSQKSIYRRVAVGPGQECSPVPLSSSRPSYTYTAPKGSCRVAGLWRHF